MREIIRAGIDSIDKGQMEAAKSLGMRYGLAMRRIILPQAARVIVPPLGNEFNNMMKTHLARLHDRRLRAVRRSPSRATRRRSTPSTSSRSPFWYLFLTTVWTFIQAWIERRLARERPRRAS